MACVQEALERIRYVVVYTSQYLEDTEASSAGSLIHFSGLGTSVLSVNSYHAAYELLDKKGSIYSDRPRLPSLKELYVSFPKDHNLSLKMSNEAKSNVASGCVGEGKESI